MRIIQSSTLAGCIPFLYILVQMHTTDVEEGARALWKVSAHWRTNLLISGWSSKEANAAYSFFCFRQPEMHLAGELKLSGKCERSAFVLRVVWTVRCSSLTLCLTVLQHNMVSSFICVINQPFPFSLPSCWILKGKTSFNLTCQVTVSAFGFWFLPPVTIQIKW